MGGILGAAAVRSEAPGCCAVSHVCRIAGPSGALCCLSLAQPSVVRGLSPEFGASFASSQVDVCAADTLSPYT